MTPSQYAVQSVSASKPLPVGGTKLPGVSVGVRVPVGVALAVALPVALAVPVGVAVPVDVAVPKG